MIKNEKKIDEIMFTTCWEYVSGTERCKGCAAYKWNDEPHKEDCAYGELLEIIKKAKEE